MPGSYTIWLFQRGCGPVVAANFHATPSHTQVSARFLFPNKTTLPLFWWYAMGRSIDPSGEICADLFDHRACAETGSARQPMTARQQSAETRSTTEREWCT